MSEPDDLLPFSALPKSETALPSIGDSLSEIVGRFTGHGALGVLAIDASAFSEIERVPIQHYVRRPNFLGIVVTASDNCGDSLDAG